MLSSTQFAIIVFTLFEVIILSDRRIYAAETGEAVNNYQFLYRGNKDNNDDDNRIVVKDYYAQDSSTHFQLSTKPYVVEFYSPSCGHCQVFKAKYIAVAKEIMADSTVLASITNKNYNDPIQFYAVSCEAYHSLCNDYSIMGYPTTYAVIPSPDQENNNNWTNTPKQQIHAFELNSEMLLNIFKMINRTNNNTTQQDPNTVSAIDSHDNNNRAEEEDQNDVNDDDVSGERENASLPTSESKTRNDERNKGKENNMLKKSINVPVHFNNINKFQDILKGQLRKQEQLRQKKPKHQPASMKSSFNGGDAHGATSIMKANRYGTKEYNLRKHKIVSQLLQKLKTNNHQKLSKVFHNNNANARKHQPMTESLPSFQKHISKPHFMERIPIINKFTAISKEEELIWDVSLAFIDSIKRSALLLNPILQQDTKNNNGVNIPFNATQQQIQHELLIRWLQLASISLPQEWSIHTTINDLLHNIATQKNENYENDSYILLQVLQRHPFQRSTYSPSCTYNKKILTTNDGFFCGFWKLLHVITVGIAMHRGGIDLIHTKTTSIDHTASNNNASVSMDIASSIFSPRDASNTMQQFISTFIQSSSCRDCISNFLTVHYDCEKHKKCYELTSNTYTAFENEWKMVALWLWEFHNDMSILLINRKHDVIRKYKQQHSIMSNWNNPGAGPGAASLHEEVTVVWPSVDMCFDCFNSDGAFDEDTVFLHIEQSYWPGHDLEDTPSNLLSFLVDDETSGGMRWTLVLIICSLTLLVVVNKTIHKASIQNTLLRAKNITTAVVAGDKKIDRSA